jgi:hypothetical protein
MIEVKNISGTVIFDSEYNQIIRIKNGKEEAFSDPIVQSEYHLQQLRAWLEYNRFPKIPIEYLIVISNPHTLIKSSSTHIESRVIHSATIPKKIDALKKQFTKKYFTKELKIKLSQKLITNHEPLNINIVKYFQISLEDIVKGVICEKCDSLPMKRIKGKWHCSNYGGISKNAHISSLNDYFLLIRPTITNRELRDFLCLPSRFIATSLLRSLDFQSSEERKSRKYQLVLK